MIFRSHRCEREFELEALLDSNPSYHPALAMASLRCPKDRAPSPRSGHKTRIGHRDGR